MDKTLEELNKIVNSMNILILEDDPERIRCFKRWFSRHNLTVVNHAQDAIDNLRTKEFSLVFLDHDLDGRVFVPSDEPNTGFQVAVRFGEFSRNFGTNVIIHSMNGPAAQRMERVISMNAIVNLIPFSYGLKQLLDSLDV